MKFAEIPARLNPLLHPPDPIVRFHLFSKIIKNNQLSIDTFCLGYQSRDQC